MATRLYRSRQAFWVARSAAVGAGPSPQLPAAAFVVGAPACPPSPQPLPPPSSPATSAPLDGCCSRCCCCCAGGAGSGAAPGPPIVSTCTSTTSGHWALASRTRMWRVTPLARAG